MTSVLDSMLPDTAYLIEEIEAMSELKNTEVKRELMVLLLELKVERGTVDTIMFWWRRDEADR